MLKASQIANDFNLELIGEDKEINNFTSLNNQKNDSISWVKTANFLAEIKEGIFLVSNDLKDELNSNSESTFLLCEKSPRLMFARVLNKYFSDDLPNDFLNCVDAHRNNNKISIGENCFIGENVTIGDGTKILHNSSIFSNTKIGSNCLINSNVSIGTPGLGFEYDGSEMVKFPQFGGVEIGDRVEIGPNSTVRRGALENTEIGSETKIGSLSNIGHNCKVGKQCILTCQIALGGSTKVGDKVFMGINSSTKNSVVIGNDCTIGMGSIVTKNIPEGATAYGIPAKVSNK